MKTKNSAEFSKFNASIEKILSVPHAELKRREEEWKKQRRQKKHKRAEHEKSNRVPCERG